MTRPTRTGRHLPHPAAGLYAARVRRQCRCRCRKPRPAFSLIELMIAIVILGFGMVMAASMFPVGWSRARKLSEHTVVMSVTQSTHTTLQSLLRPAGPDYSSASFAGDLIYAADHAYLGAASVRQVSDTRVHALHLENIRIVGPAFVPEDPWVLEVMDDTFMTGHPEIVPDPDAETYRLRAYFSPQVRFHERLHPPMKPRADSDLAVADERWDGALDSRRYCWAVFHKLRKIVGVDIFTPDDERQPRAAQAIGDTRVFDMYYVTLRRPRSTLRFAVQDPDPDNLPNPYDRLEVAPVPQALDPTFDTVLPVPWRVQIEFDPDVLSWENPAPGSGLPPPTFVPTEVMINGLGVDYLIDFFPEDTVLIDEVSGKLYRVASRRLISGTTDQAILTLDREIFVEDLDDSDQPPYFQNGTLEDDETLRTVWLFPPPVQPRQVGDDPVFEGKSPVVDVELRTLSVSPGAY